MSLLYGRGLEEERMHLKLHRNFEFPEKRRWVDNRAPIR